MRLCVYAFLSVFAFLRFSVYAFIPPSLDRQTATSAFDLHAAVAAAQAGAIIVVPPGIYRGTLVIRQPMTLIARAGAGGGGEVILDGGGEGDVVRVAAPDVTIRGFVIRASGAALEHEHAGIAVSAPRVTIENNTIEDVLFGLLLKAAPNSVIRNNTIGGKPIDIARRGDGIRLWQSPDTLIEGNTVTAVRDVVMWFSANIILRHNRVTDSRYGMHFMYTDDNIIEGNLLQDNSVGAFLMYSRNLTVRGNIFANSRGPSGYGLGLKDMDRIVAEDNLFVGNRVGVYLDNSPQRMDITDDFTRNVFAGNDIGVAFQPNVKRNNFSENTFMENLQQVAVIGSGEFSGNAFTVNGKGNFWSDYRGFDLDRDGVGDLAYCEESLFENLMAREPKLRLFLHSPAQQAIDLAARAFPIVQPRPCVQDDAPLMQPVRANVVAPLSARSSLPMWLSSGILFTIAGLALCCGRRQSQKRINA